MSEQKVYDKAREMEREAHAVEEAEIFDEAADRASLEVVLDQDDAQAIVTREGQDPQGLGGEAIERGPAGMRPEESRAQPFLHIEPVHLIFYDDTERRPEIFGGQGATAAAHHRFKVISGQWNAHLFVKIKSNTRDDPFANANAVLASPTTPTEGPAQTWRCFHCDEAFSDAEQARLHFGASERQRPSCQVSPEELRALEAELARYREEDTDLHRELHRKDSDHQQALMREEEKGYARGLRDGMDESKVRAGTLTDPEGAS